MDRFAPVEPVCFTAAYLNADEPVPTDSERHFT